MYNNSQIQTSTHQIRHDIIPQYNLYINSTCNLCKLRFHGSNEVTNETAEFGLNDVDEDTLTLHNIARDQAGPYTCQVHNDMGQGLSDPFHLDVLCKF